MSFAERLKIALDDKNLKPADLSRITGIGRPAITAYLKGDYEAKQTNLYKISRALDVNEAWLMGLDVKRTPHRTEFQLLSDVDIFVSNKEKKYAPVLNVAAGAFHEDISQLEEEIEIPEKWEHLHGKLFAIRVVGESMNRVLPNGVTILCEDISQTGYQVKNGDYVVFEYNGEYTVKKLVDTSTMIILDPYSYDDGFEPMVFTKSDDLDLKILGVVRRSFMDF